MVCSLKQPKWCISHDGRTYTPLRKVDRVCGTLHFDKVVLCKNKRGIHEGNGCVSVRLERFKDSFSISDTEIGGFQGELIEDLECFFKACSAALDPSKVLVLHTSSGKNYSNALNGRDRSSIECLINLKRLNDIQNINALLEEVNKNLVKGGRFVGCFETYSQRKADLKERYPGFLNKLIYAADFVFKRVAPKLPVISRVCFYLTRGQNKRLSMAEVFGRLYYAGFELESYELIGKRLYFKVRKRCAVNNLKELKYGIIIQMSRIGQGGKRFNVYKVRTMHAYSEYLQEYVYQRNNLQEGGKIRNDFRVTTIGRFFRRSFMDEWPMFFNILRGEMKLVGIRPISEQFLSLYDQDVRLMRNMMKPGLVPPFYADMPKSLAEIQESEKRYIRAYLQDPFKTDVIYFFKSFVNIVFKNARSS